MAQQMITLEEAATRLGITPEEMKKRLKTDPDFKRLSQIRDGATVRFKLAAIEELARQLGMASEQDLPLAPVGDEPPGSDDFKVSGLGGKKKGDDSPLEFDSSAEQDVFSLADDPKPAPPKSSGKLTPNKPAAAGKGMSDSSAGSSDSDVRLDAEKPRKAAGDEAAIPTEEISLDFGGPGSAVIKGGSAAKLSAPRPSPSSGKLSAAGPGRGGDKPPADSSEFELSLDADSDDFELQMNSDAGDEVDLGTMPQEKGGGASSNRAGKSGINLRDPADSGIQLDKEKGKAAEAPAEPEAEAEPDFELSLDSSSVASSTRLGAPKSGKLVLDEADSDSEFELTLEDTGGSSLEQAALGAAEVDEAAADKGDIFETDFEIPPMDESGSEAVPVESDTDLEKSDFAPIDEETGEEAPQGDYELGEEDEEPAPAAKSSTKLKGKEARKGDEDEEAERGEEEGDESPFKGVKTKRRRAGDEEEEEEEEAAPAGAVVERPTKPWGVVPALLLAPTVLVVLLGGLMGYEMLNTMWGYQQPRKPAAPLIRGIASTFDMELRDQ